MFASRAVRRGRTEPKCFLQVLDRLAVAEPASRHLVGEKAGLPHGVVKRARLDPLDPDEVLAKLGIVGVVRQLLRFRERSLQNWRFWPSTSTSNSVTGFDVSLTTPTPT